MKKFVVAAATVLAAVPAAGIASASTPPPDIDPAAEVERFQEWAVASDNRAALTIEAALWPKAKGKKKCEAA